MKKSILALALIAPLAACQNPNGSTDWGSTLALGGAAGVGAAVLGGAINDSNQSQRYRPYYGRGHGRPPVYYQQPQPPAYWRGQPYYVPPPVQHYPPPSSYHPRCAHWGC